MSDSPAVQAPLDPKEQPILDSLLQIRDQLSLLKQDRSTYIKSHDVLSLYEQVIEQVQLLNVLRRAQRKPLEQNRVDNVLDDCFQLISLFFLTIGRNNEAPAVYSLTSTVKRLLDHLQEAAFYTAKDLDSINHTCDSMRETLERGKETYSPHLLTLLQNRLDKCQVTLSDLRKPLANLSSELTPLHEKLVSILRSMAAANSRQKFPASEVEGFQHELEEIKNSMVDGKFVTEGKSEPAGQEVVVGLLNRCLIWAELVLNRQGKIDDRFRPPYDKLCGIRNQLEKLSLTQAWSLRETDLYSYQRQLDRIDESRVNGNFLDDQGNPADLHAQRLNSIDNMRVDGKFMIGKDIPEGQGSVNSLLAECFDLIYELRVEAEENESD
ncbi:hypothetical protein MMC16_000634 [Acarospora aff. strigata]|nr:hypothetical protein [Acarospora aff. strigata]